MVFTYNGSRCLTNRLSAVFIFRQKSVRCISDRNRIRLINECVPILGKPSAKVNVTFLINAQTYFTTAHEGAALFLQQELTLKVKYGKERRAMPGEPAYTKLAITLNYFLNGPGSSVRIPPEEVAS